MIVPENHIPGDINRPLYLSGSTRRGIRINDNVWIGAGARILDGVEIGRNSIVGAGSVVTKSIPENVTVVGVPARTIKARSIVNNGP